MTQASAAGAGDTRWRYSERHGYRVHIHHLRDGWHALIRGPGRGLTEFERSLVGPSLERVAREAESYIEARYQRRRAWLDALGALGHREA